MARLTGPTPARDGRVRSPKGEREAARILAAATSVLAREGIDGATLGRIAAEAGVDKKMLVYYFSGREALLVEVVHRVGERVARNMEAAVAGLSDLDELAGVVLERLWQGTTEEPELARAYLALAANGQDRAEVRRALAALKAEFTALFARLVDGLEAQGYRLVADRDGYLTLLLATWRGLALTWVEEGETPALRAALAQLKRAAMAGFVPPA